MSKIVVIDDSYAELQLIEGYLKSANHTVVSYPNTDKLEDKLAVDKPDLIVLDVVMPGRNGFQTCRDLKNDDRFKGIPIVLCTSKRHGDQTAGDQNKGTAGGERLGVVVEVLGNRLNRGDLFVVTLHRVFERWRQVHG